jgi:GNAT superfamily N-acetyltransferase
VVDLRSARPADAPDVARLLGQLGYPTTEAQATGRLGRLLDDPASDVIVALDGERVVGLAGLHVQPLLQDDAVSTRLIALVVDEAERGRGIGAALVAEVERQAAARGCGRLDVSSADHRATAHAFYEALGFEQAPARRYRRRL